MTPPHDDQAAPDRRSSDARVNRTIGAVCLTVLLLAILALYGWVSTRGGNLSSLVTFLALAILPIGSSLANSVLVGSVKKDLHNVRHDVRQVQEQTNGNTSRLLDITEQAVQALPTAMAPQEPPTAPPDTLGPAHPG
jgi:hypothetical protein